MARRLKFTCDFPGECRSSREVPDEGRPVLAPTEHGWAFVSVWTGEEEAHRVLCPAHKAAVVELLGVHSS